MFSILTNENAPFVPKQSRFFHTWEIYRQTGLSLLSCGIKSEEKRSLKHEKALDSNKAERRSTLKQLVIIVS
jgi:hypothetical protein